MRQAIVATLAVMLVAVTDVRGASSERLIRFEGTSFKIDSTLASSVDTQIVPAVPLEYPTDVPDGVGPQHLLFTFRGPSETGIPQAREAAQMRIYPISAYERIWAPSKDTIDSLRAMLARPGESWTREIPFLPWADVSQPFRSHVRRIAFGDGAGVGFVTAYAIEPTPVTNGELEYTFQGLTTDGASYVSITIPIRSTTLKDSEPMDDWEGFARRYPEYLEEITRRLDAAPASGFTPDLDRIETMIRSLCVSGSACVEEAPRKEVGR
jgi:hypothetical protein